MLIEIVDMLVTFMQLVLNAQADVTCRWINSAQSSIWLWLFVIVNRLKILV
jgi:hypothetical protein